MNLEESIEKLRCCDYGGEQVAWPRAVFEIQRTCAAQRFRRRKGTSTDKIRAATAAIARHV